MTDTAILAFPECLEAAGALAGALALPVQPIDLHRFPDGETLLTVPAFPAHAIVFRSLHHPNGKLFELAMAASALRAGGSATLTLVAPYMGYMRQDMEFAPGQAVTQRVVGRFLAEHFDRMATVDPHLHRCHDTGLIFPGAEVLVKSAAATLGQALVAEGAPAGLVIVGPDEESEPWARAAAAPGGYASTVGRKIRHGDREVELTLPDDPPVAGRHVVLVDDVISSGMTLVHTAELVRARGAASVEVLAVHALHDDAAADKMEAAGITRVRSTDSIPHPTNAIGLAGLLADGLVT